MDFPAFRLKFGVVKGRLVRKERLKLPFEQIVVELQLFKILFALFNLKVAR